MKYYVTSRDTDCVGSMVAWDLISEWLCLGDHESLIEPIWLRRRVYMNSGVLWLCLGHRTDASVFFLPTSIRGQDDIPLHGSFLKNKSKNDTHAVLFWLRWTCFYWLWSKRDEDFFLNLEKRFKNINSTSLKKSWKRECSIKMDLTPR